MRMCLNQGLHLHLSQHIICFMIQGKNRWPSSAADEGLIVSADFGNLAIWATQRRLCLALRLLAAAKEAAMKLATGGSKRAGQTRVNINVNLAAVGFSPVYVQGQSSIATRRSKLRLQNNEA